MDPWYREGLRFECTGCGKCCKGRPGYVWLTIEEMIAIADFLKIPFDQFTKKNVRQVNGDYSLIEVGEENACVFLEENKCTIYEVRPKQCRTFPFWGKHLITKENWEDLKGHCEGIDERAPLISLDEIRRRGGS
jgi:Predicted Fe-S-cluster oxidoreductase